MSTATKTERNAEIVRRYTAGDTAAQLADDYDVTPKRIYAILKNERRRGTLTTRVVNVLDRLGIEPGDIDAIAALPASQLLKQSGMGNSSFNTLQAYLHSHGRDFGEEQAPVDHAVALAAAKARWEQSVRVRDEAIIAARVALAEWTRLERQALATKESGK
jgi:hypothetical protein